MKKLKVSRLASQFATAAIFVSTMSGQSAPEVTWRCSLDGKAYSIQVSADEVRITGVAAGKIQANVPIRLDKKGRQAIRGQWQAGPLIGFIQLNQVGEDVISGYILAPQRGTAPNSCATRTLAILSSIGNANQNQGCERLEINWQRQNISIDQAASFESPIQSIAPTQSQTDESSARVPDSMVGTWVSVDAGAVHYTKIELDLRADGTYTKTLRARTPGWGGGGTIGATGLGGTHDGRWTAMGMTVHLSGDGNWPASDHDLRGFQKIR